MKPNTILVIDDELDCRETMCNLLSKNFSVSAAASGAEGMAMAATLKPDLFLIDFQMPDTNGIEVCKLIRKNADTKSTPIIMVSAHADENARTESFLWGADDFIAKPYSGRELLARVMSKLSWSRQPVSDGNSHKLGNLVIDHDRLEIKVNDELIPMTHFEMKLLRYFISNQNKVLSRENILTTVWRDSQVTSRTIDTHVYYLRKKLTSFDHEFTTVHGAGYILKLKT